MTQQSHYWAYTLRKPKLKDICTPVFIAALFTIARRWKQARCPLTDEWMKTLWYMNTVKYYSVIKRNTFESVLMRWINLEPIMQSEVGQKEKDKYCILTHIYGIQKNGTENLLTGQQWRNRHRESTKKKRAWQGIEDMNKMPSF